MEVTELLRIAKVALSLEDCELVKKLGGKSKAFVLGCNVKSAGFSGEAVIKFDAEDDSASTTSACETDKHASLFKIAKHFAVEYVPRLIRCGELESFKVSMYDVAGLSLRSVRSLASIEFLDAMSVFQNVARVFANGLGAGLEVRESLEPVQSLLEQWLGYRLDPRQGRIYDFLQDHLKVDPLVSNLSWGTTVLPNPYAFARSSTAEAPILRIRATIGYVHGDLHGENILVDRFLRRNKVKIIDFAEASPALPLFFDHAYLELIELLRMSENTDIFLWLELLERLSRILTLKDLPKRAHSNFEHPLSIAASIRNGMHNELQKNSALPHPDQEYQILLARIAVGLTFVHRKSFSAKDRTKALAYSSRALFDVCELCGLELPLDKGELHLDGATPVDAANAQEIWESCGAFDAQRYAYVLLISEGVEFSGWDVRQISRIPWAMVLDLNPSTVETGFIGIAASELTSKVINIRAPDDVAVSDFVRSGSWIMAGGDSRLGEHSRPLREWRHKYLRNIEKHLSALHSATNPKPIRLIIISGENSNQKATALWDSIDTELGNTYSTVIFCGRRCDQHERLEDVHRLPLDPGDLAKTVFFIMGQASDPGSISLPVRSERGETSVARELRAFKPEELQHLEGAVEIVHGALAWRDEDLDREVNHFYRGGLISWRDLDDHLDVDRNIVLGLKTKILEQAFGNVRIPRFQVEHAPGAGGTTVARRVAWDLKEQFPVVVVRNMTDELALAQILQEIFELTSLPVVAVVEMSRVTDSGMNALVGQLKSQHTRVVLITVRRVSIPRTGSQIFPLGRTMGDIENRRFLQRYRSLCKEPSSHALNALAEDRRFEKYRVPFFFGLFAFEERFNGVPEYVSNHMGDLPYIARDAYTLISTVSAYSQATVPVEIVIGALGRDPDVVLDPEREFGADAQRLLVFENAGIRIVHPLLAKEVLKLTLGGGEDSEWKHRLGELAVKLIDLVAATCDAGSFEARQLLADLFIRREAWPDIFGQERRRNFSELVLDIGGNPARSKVLEELTARFPSDPHFWNHRGRFASIEEKNYALAVECLSTAKSLAPDDHLHCHSLGMVHRYEVRRRLDSLKGSTERTMDIALSALDDISDVFRLAGDCFEQARTLAPEDEHGYITDIQLIEETIHALDAISGGRGTHIVEQNTLGIWCGEQLQKAEGLIWRARTITLHRDAPSDRLQRLEGKIQALYGRFDKVIAMFEGALEGSISGPDAIYARRLLTAAYFANSGRSWEAVSEKVAQRIVDLSAQNIHDGRASAWDIRYWLHASRRLANFELREALAKLERLVDSDPSLEAYYYLYVMRFLEWFTCHTTNSIQIQQAENKCKELSGKFQKSFPFEWIAQKPFACPLLHRASLGEWSKEQDFFEDASRLKRVRGVIVDIKGPQAGSIEFVPPCSIPSARYQKMKAFFVPRGHFLPTVDLRVGVEFYLGLSYDGLRAYSVERTGQ